MATIRVSPGSSIQQAINAAVDGYIVIVSQGTYKEALTITGKRITLASEFYNTGDPADIVGTVLDGGTNGRDALDLITVTDAVGTKIIGFTIQNGNDGIQINNSTGVEILNNLNLASGAYKGNAPNLGVGESGFTTQPLGSIGDRTWHDTDGDGVQGTGESWIAGIAVKLLNSFHHIITTQVTGSNGNYLFNNLLTNTDDVQVDKNTLPRGARETGDPDVGNNNTAKVIFAKGENNLSQDFGDQLPLLDAIGDRIWNDTDGDGVEDAGESGIADVKVKLLDLANNVLCLSP